MDDGIFSSSLKKVGNKLIHIKKGDDEKYKDFIRDLNEGDKVNLYMEIHNADNTLLQLAKVHKIIRVLATHTGNTYMGMKLAVKDRAGLCVHDTAMGKTYTDWMSFADCSKDELSLAIQATVELGDIVGLNLR